MFSVKHGNYEIEGISHYYIQDEVLYLDKLHLEGAVAGALGRKALWEIAKELGRQLTVLKVVIQGARRTTGKYKGSVPSPIRIDVDA